MVIADSGQIVTIIGAGMLRPVANFIARIDSAYSDRPYFVGLKARLLAAFSLLMLVFAPLNTAKLLWVELPRPMLRIGFNLCFALAAVLSLRWIQSGKSERAGNILVLASIIPVILLGLLVPSSYLQPLSSAVQLFAFALLYLLVALVFASRRVAFGVLAIAVTGHVLFHLRAFGSDYVAGSIQFAANTLLRDGLIAFGLVFCLGLTLVRMIETAQRRSEDALAETRAMNENLGRLVTERTRELEAETHRANRASRAKSDFLANMSHEIRTPLNGIIASADLLGRSPDLPTAAAEQVRLIADSGDLLLKQVGDILDFSKIEEGQVVLEAHGFELATLVAGCVSLVSATASKGGIRLEYALAAGLPLHFEGDSFRLRQVLLNLMSNAIKFTPPGGRVRLTINSSDSESNPVPVLFEVRDTGIGIGESAIKKLFERFTQADSSTTRRYGGTGLGLAISSRLVGMMSGQLEVQSAPGQGSRFYFTIPLRVIEASAVVVEPSQRLSCLGLRVLVAEDNAINRKILGAQLEVLGCPCTMAADGEEVLIALQQAPPPDVVLMDCHMPNLDGWETTRRIRGWAIERDVSEVCRQASLLPVIALTAAALPEERVRCLDAGMTAFLSKPVKLADLHRALRSFSVAADVN